jgi:hypothetical protein
MYVVRVVELTAKRRDEGQRKHGNAILETLAVANEQLVSREFDVFDAKTHCLHHAHSCSVQEAAEKHMNAAQRIEQTPDFVTREDDG